MIYENHLIVSIMLALVVALIISFLTSPLVKSFS